MTKTNADFEKRKCYQEVNLKLEESIKKYNDEVRDIKGKEPFKSQHYALLEKIVNYYLSLKLKNDERTKGFSKTIDSKKYFQLNITPVMFLKNLCKKKGGRNNATSDYNRINRHYLRLEESKLIMRKTNENGHTSIFISSALF